MKKNIKAALIAVFCLTAGYTTYNSQNKNEKLSDVMLDNVEALAGGEWGGGSNCRWSDWNYQFCTPNGYGLGCPCYM